MRVLVSQSRRGFCGQGVGTYVVGAINSVECVGACSLAQCEGMRDLEKRVQAEWFGEVGAEASEHVVVEQDIALDLLGEALDGPRIGEAELCASLLERAVRVREGL